METALLISCFVAIIFLIWQNFQQKSSHDTLEPIKEKLEQYEKKVESFSNSWNRSHASLDTYLKSVGMKAELII